MRRQAQSSWPLTTASICPGGSGHSACPAPLQHARTSLWVQVVHACRDQRCAHPEAPVAWLQAVLQAQLKGERHVLPGGQTHRAALQEGAWSRHHGAQHLHQAQGLVCDACSPKAYESLLPYYR